MWIRSLLLAALATLFVMPAPLGAQDEPPVADFTTVREQFIGGQSRQAAQTLLRSTVYLRHQVGRSRDEVVGMQLLAAETQVEKLATAIGSGRGPGLKELDQALSQVDRLLALHFVQVAGGTLLHPRATDVPVIARDMKRGALHFERSFTLSSRPIPPDAEAVLGDVRLVAKDMELSGRIPANTKTVLAAFEKQLTGVVVMAVSMR